MTDLEPWEFPALDFASDCAGEYLEELNQTDLAKLTPDQWKELIRVIAVNFAHKRADIMPCPF